MFPISDIWIFICNTPNVHPSIRSPCSCRGSKWDTALDNMLIVAHELGWEMLGPCGDADGEVVELRKVVGATDGAKA